MQPTKQQWARYQLALQEYRRVKGWNAYQSIPAPCEGITAAQLEKHIAELAV